MFGWVDFKEDGKEKKKWKIEEKMSGKGIWLRGGGEKENWWDPAFFSPDAPKFNISKTERK